MNGGGKGFNADRDDVNVISFHRGVVTKDDGLVDSVLSEDHKFDNPIVKLSIRRIK